MGAADRPVVMAAVAGAHGVTGEVRLKLFTDSVESLLRHHDFDCGGRALTLLSARPGPHGAIARFAELRDRTAAEALRGALLTVPRASLPPLPPGEHYWHDLIGLAVVDAAGARLGTVVDMANYGASDLLEIELEGSRRVLVPLVEGAARVEDGQIRIDRAWIEAA
ncbi:MAG: ribosome maturation factor RimM [Sphingomonadaceae bacterium]